MFWQNEEFSEGLGREIHLDGVVCVVDAVFGYQVCVSIPASVHTLMFGPLANARRPLS